MRNDDDDILTGLTANIYGYLEKSEGYLKISEWLEELKFFREESIKISNCCGKECHMGKDMRLIKKEFEQGYKPYEMIVIQYNKQLEECPKICLKYRRDIDEEKRESSMDISS